MGQPSQQYKRKPLTLLKPGMASFAVIDGYDKDREGNMLMSSTGNPMLKLVLMATDSTGDSGKILQYFTMAMGWRIGSFLECIGKRELNNPNALFKLDDVLGCEGKCVLKTDTEYNPDEPRSTVEEWLKPFDRHAPIKPDKLVQAFFAEADGLPNDEIPF